MGKWVKNPQELDNIKDHFDRKDARKKPKIKGAEDAFLKGGRVEITFSGQHSENELNKNTPELD